METLEKAKKGHQAWMKRMTDMVHSMSVEPIQMNPKKCAFGHFYEAIHIKHKALEEEWNRLGVMHGKLHGTAPKLLNDILNGDSAKAEAGLKECEKIAGQVIGELDELQRKIRELTECGENVF